MIKARKRNKDKKRMKWDKKDGRGGKKSKRGKDKNKKIKKDNQKRPTEKPKKSHCPQQRSQPPGIGVFRSFSRVQWGLNLEAAAGMGAMPITRSSRRWYQKLLPPPQAAGAAGKREK